MAASREIEVFVYFKQFYLGCLAQASYLIGSEGEGAVVDPRRDVDEYLAEARAHGLTIKYVIETHLHADFVSGHRELAERCAAQVVFGARAAARYEHLAVHDGDELHLGRLVLRFLETPGHTPEGVSVLVIDPAQGPQPLMVLTGDTLFIGDVGRPDLAGRHGHSAAQMAGLLYDSLHGKLLNLPDDVQVYPGHGAGSLCGRNLARETRSTIGEQRRTNYALQPMPRERFVEMLTADLPEAPAYFPASVERNRSGAPALPADALPRALAPAALHAQMATGALVLDVRAGGAFGTGHVPGALNIGLNGQFAVWCGSLLPADAALVLVADDAAGVREAVTRLARVGHEHVVGFLAGGIAAWDAAGQKLASLPQMPVDELRARLDEPGADLHVLDVRRASEYAAGHVPGARLAPLHDLQHMVAELDRRQPTAVICAGGYRSSAAVSLLARAGFERLYNVVGGTAAWQAAGHAMESA